MDYHGRDINESRTITGAASNTGNDSKAVHMNRGAKCRISGWTGTKKAGHIAKTRKGHLFASTLTTGGLQMLVNRGDP